MEASNIANYEAMGPTMLAAQPATEKVSEERKSKDWQVIFSYLEQRLNSLRTWRWSWWAYWNVLAEYILPRRHQWIIVANRMNRGSPINNSIIDGTATLATQTCSSGLWTGLTSPSRPWFKLGVGLPWIKLQADGKDWLEAVEQRLYTVLAQSNFYSMMSQCFQDVTVFGTSPMIIYEDFEDVIRCYLPCVGEYYLAVGARFSVDTLYREFTLTIAQIVEMFGFDNCPAEVQQLWNEGTSLDTERVVAHAIEPNFDLSGKGADKGRAIKVVPGVFTYRELYWLRGVKQNAELSRKGFHEAPFMVARWATVSNDAYGRSPCMDALGDVRQVQAETRRKAEFIEKGIRPPMGAGPEMKNEPSSIQPGAITYVTSDGQKKGFWPLFEPNPQWLPAITSDIDKVNARIERTLFVDLFMAISRMEGVQPRNELELTKRDLERLQSLGPFINQFETEFASPAIERVFAILERRKMLPPKPASLNNVPIKIHYVSIMKLAQRAAEQVALKDVLTTAGELTEAALSAGIAPPARIINLDEALREYADLANANPKILFTEDQVKQNDAAKAKAQQGQQQGQNLGAAVQAAQGLSQTKIAPDNALGAMLQSSGAKLPGAA